MPPRKRTPGSRPRNGPRASAKLATPIPLPSAHPHPPSTPASEIPAIDNSHADATPKTATLEALPVSPSTPPVFPEVEYRNTRLIGGERVVGEGDGNDKPTVAKVAVPERSQDGIHGSKVVEMAGCEGSESAERDGNKESAAVEDSTSVKKRKKVVKVVKKVVKKVMRKKLVPKDRVSNLESEMEYGTPEVSNGVEGMLSAVADRVPEEASMEVGKPDPNVSVALVGDSATEGDENVNRIEKDDEKNEGFGTEIVIGDEKNRLSVSVGEETGTDGDVIGESGGQKEVSGDRIALGDESDKLEVDSEVMGEEANVGLADRSKNFKVGVGNDEGVKGENDKTGEGSSMEEYEKGSGWIALSGELEALERRKRRNTEIFVGGLDKDTGEEDLRKVFEQVGEVIEVRLVIDGKTGKNKGFGFIRYTSAADAKRALEKYEKVEICGKMCTTSPVEGNDTIFLGNIDRKWKTEDVLELLQKIGILRIDKVTVMVDPRNAKRNRGFAFLELETKKDAKNTYKILKKLESSGKLYSIKVDWAQPLSEPDEEEMLKVKSVYVEYLPSSWDEKKVRHHFEKFGQIESVVLSQNLHSSRRTDFAFINFTNREAALACIESLNDKPLSSGASKLKLKVSLAKPMPKIRPNKNPSNFTNKEIAQREPRKVPYSVQHNESQMKISSRRHFVNDKDGDKMSHVRTELVRLYGQQDSSRESRERLKIGSTYPDYSYSSGMKRSFHALEGDSYRSYPRQYFDPHWESSFPVGSPSYGGLSQDFGMSSQPYNWRQSASHGSSHASGYRYANYEDKLQWEDAANLGNTHLPYRYRG